MKPLAPTVLRSARNIRWIEEHCFVPEGKLVGQPVRLREWQREIIRGIYDSPTRTAIVSFGRKNGKTALAAFIVLLHLCGPEKQANSQLCSAAQSKDQAALLFQHAAKMVRLSPDLSAVIRIRETVKELICPELGTEYKALSADVATNLGKSPVLIVHDELGQVRGARSELYEALETATGAHDEPMSVIISTQAPRDADLLSILIDDAKTARDPRIKVWLWTAPLELEDPFSQEAKAAANPALGDFLNRKEVDSQAENARNMPARESSYRNLVLNQRVESKSPFVSRIVWNLNGRDNLAPFEGRDVWAGLDLSAVRDLTSLEVIAANEDGSFDVDSTFWLPGEGLKEKAHADRVPYDLWAEQGFLQTTPGASIEYEFVACHLRELFDRCNVRKLAFDRYNLKFLKPWLEKKNFTEEELERFVEFGQGFISMGPALREFEGLLVNSRLRHGGHPVLTMCAANARTIEDPAKNRKLIKSAETARIDGMVALAMAIAVARSELSDEDGPSVYETRGMLAA